MDRWIFGGSDWMNDPGHGASVVLTPTGLVNSYTNSDVWSWFDWDYIRFMYNNYMYSFI